MNTIRECQKKLESGLTSVQLTEDYLNRIEQLNPKINAYITICREEALEMARKADLRRKSGKALTALTGIPIALKDALITKGIRTTAASKILANHRPVYNGTVVQKLIDAGAVILGKLNMDEFAMGSSNENSAFGPVCNPWNINCTPGGSSGGSAAAVSADLCVAALGSDTGGSIRQPAALTGIVGLKPTYGRVSRYGLIAFASSLDQIGPMTKTVEDAAIMLSHFAGFDPKDSTSLQEESPDFSTFLKEDVSALRLGFPREYFTDGMDSEIVTALKAARKKFEDLGAICTDISLPHTEYAVPCYYIVAPAEACSNLARYDGVRYGYRSQDAKVLKEMYDQSRSEAFGDEVKLRIMIGTYVLSSGYYDAYYKKAQSARTLIKQDFERALEEVDAIITPTSPTVAFRLHEKTDDPLKMYLSDIFTVPANLAGIPGISIPCGFTKSGLPIGMQVLGRCLDEKTILRVAHTYERDAKWYQHQPVVG